MSPQGESHSSLTAWLQRRLSRELELSFEVRQHSAFAASHNSEPEPDISISLRRKRRPSHPNEALLLIEVAESSLERDRGIKSAIYAENGAAEYWIVDVEARCVWVYTDAMRGAYRNVVKLGRRGTLVPTRLPNIRISVADMFALR